MRHPASIPIEVTASPNRPARETLREVGHGGLSFHALSGVEPGEVISIRIAASSPPTEIEAQVVWCHQSAGGFDVGVQFLGGDDAFRARMVEQVCHIRHYRRQVLTAEGRRLSRHQAALEWIAKHAGTFPGAPAPGAPA